MANKLNTLFHSIGDNTLNNEKTSISIIEEYLKLNSAKKLNVNGSSIFTLIVAKNSAGIVSELRGQQKVEDYHTIRKNIVDKILLKLANLNNLISVEKKPKTKLAKSKVKEENQSSVEIDFSVNKSDTNIKNNAMRNTANNVCFPIVFLLSQSNESYAFEKNRVRINIKPLSKEIVKTVFGFNKDKADINSMFCNLTMLIKLAKVSLYNVKVLRSIKDTEETEEAEEAVSDLVSGEYSEEKAKNIVNGIVSMLGFLDKNKSFDSILQIENHIQTLELYGQAKFDMTNNVRKQLKKSIELFGSASVEFNQIKDLKANTFSELETEFNKRYALK